MLSRNVVMHSKGLVNDGVTDRSRERDDCLGYGFRGSWAWQRH